MTIDNVLETFLPALAHDNNKPATSEVELIMKRLGTMRTEAIPRTHFNQILHLMHQAGVSEGFFRYYFTTNPIKHPYSIEALTSTTPEISEAGIGSVAQLDWGLRRFFVDALLYFGNIRTAYRVLRVMNYEDLERFYTSRMFAPEAMSKRPDPMPLQQIPVTERWLVSEIACKGFDNMENSDQALLTDLLIKKFRAAGAKTIALPDLFKLSEEELQEMDPQGQYVLNLIGEDIDNARVSSEDDIREAVRPFKERWVEARNLALQNSKLYLSMVNELDVYVATSMRTKKNFAEMARDCTEIFGQQGLSNLKLRYFDPTLSAATSHEDKGLLECLMVKCAKALLYFAGESDSFGKDSEVAMAMSLGKPVIILCPNTKRGATRANIFRDVHPLSRLIEISTGVACGAMVTQDSSEAATLLERIFRNSMRYQLLHDGKGYYRLQEKETKSIVRLETNDRMLKESFWNYYHGES